MHRDKGNNEERFRYTPNAQGTMDRLGCTHTAVSHGRLYNLLTSSALPATAFLALFIGTSVYLLERDWASTLFLAPFSDWQPAVRISFGRLGDSLPSFLHAYAFALLLILVLGPARHARLLGALSWLAVATGLECLQADITHSLFANGTGAVAALPFVNSFQTYIVNGHFDAADLLASGLGVLLAYVASSVPEKPR
jgi:hypothetical protein